MDFIKFDIDINNLDILGLTDEMKGLYINNLYIKYDRPILLVVNSLYEANKYFQIINNFTKDVYLFPMDDFLTSEALATSPELKVNRIETINEIITNKKSIIITNLMGYLRFLPKKEMFIERTINLVQNQEYSFKKLISELYELGYERDTVVNKTGDIAVRGFVLDIFPISYENPVRIEFWGDEIVTIKEFDLNTQLTIKSLEEVSITPNTEFLIANKIEAIKKQSDLDKYISPHNISNYLESPIIIFNEIETIRIGYERLLVDIFEFNKEKNTNKKYVHQLENFIPDNSLYFVKLDNTHRSKFVDYKGKEIDYFDGKLDYINNRLNKYLDQKKTVVIALSSNIMALKLKEELANENLILSENNSIEKNKINLIELNLRRGFEYKEFIVISESEIYNRKYKSSFKYKSNFKIGSRVKDINKLNIGDFIVHEMYGIGKYLGLKTVLKNGLEKDYLQIEYKNEDKLYIPVERIDLITKYSSADGSTPKLSKLGGLEWDKTKERVRKQINDIAGDLLKLYALRETRIGHSFSKDTPEQLIFENSFEYTETSDQEKVISEIKNDMEKPYPMDRLLCGDVGFGKTEVAFRAIFKAIMDHKQVALLAPTTILSNQHYQNALERFKDFAVNIEVLNRLITPKKTKEILKKLQEGKVDLLIGTHRILSNDIKFNNLGLLVIDEEQRFGVKHKEKIKNYKNSIDVLTLTATPIPRTLQMSLAGLRSLSLIETPPVDRYPVQTYALAENNQIIKDAIYKEMSREGQVYILYNHIDLMASKVREINLLVPEAKIVTAHGRMNKNELEDVMLKFTNKEFDVLVSTTIIETGIDIPNVNTLIILDCDNFGLSQLYQLRGRVGRSDRIAYCYLMYKGNKIISEIANKRLTAIKEFTELGSGLSIAMRDLSIRGAGDLLGSNQAGYISEIGIELFMKMIEEEISKLNGTYQEKEFSDKAPVIEVSTTINEDYVQDEDLRIFIHQRINQIDSLEKLNEVKTEIEDRFGIINEEILIYMYEEWFAHISINLGINKLNQTKNSIEIILEKETTSKLNGEKLFNQITNISKLIKFQMKYNRLHLILDIRRNEKHFIFYLIEIAEAIKESLV